MKKSAFFSLSFFHVLRSSPRGLATFALWFSRNLLYQQLLAFDRLDRERTKALSIIIFASQKVTQNVVAVTRGIKFKLTCCFQYFKRSCSFKKAETKVQIEIAKERNRSPLIARSIIDQFGCLIVVFFFFPRFLFFFWSSL